MATQAHLYIKHPIYVCKTCWMLGLLGGLFQDFTFYKKKRQMND